jgi:hypothetical protein
MWQVRASPWRLPNLAVNPVTASICDRANASPDCEHGFLHLFSLCHDTTQDNIKHHYTTAVANITLGKVHAILARRLKKRKTYGMTCDCIIDSHIKKDKFPWIRSQKSESSS